MGFLDFIRNRQGQRPAAEPQSQQQKPETAKEMYTRQASQETPAAKPLNQQISPEQMARVDAVKADLQKATQQPGPETPPTTPTPSGAANPQPMQQNMMNQDNAAPDLSPTSAQAGSRAMDQEAPASSGQSQPQAQEQSQERPKTFPRRPPSWER